jgi:hypothetical protein
MKLRTIVYLNLIALITLLSLVAHAQTFSVIHNFTGGADGAAPKAGLTIQGGALYGTTFGGGIDGNGAVYQVKHVGSDWVTVPIFNFPADGSGGTAPVSRVFFAADGHLYSTSNNGGTHNNGVIFSLTPPSSVCKTVNCQDFWKEQVLHSFGVFNDGHNPSGDLVWDKQGSLYGTTGTGGPFAAGTVFEMTPSQNGWTESLAYVFNGHPDAGGPNSGVIFDGNGNLFGTTFAGGQGNTGTVFELKYVPGVGWTETILYEFQDEEDGGQPAAGLVMDGSGNLFGATTSGFRGLRDANIFELSPAGDSWTYKVIYTITGPGGCGPEASLTMDGAGNLYGTTDCDGTHFKGNVFKLANTQNGWVYTSLHDFTGGDDGGDSFSNVTIDTDGTLYGTTVAGGMYDQGVVWMIKP